MHRLNLPEFEYKLRKADGKVWIFDVIRKKYLLLTPEEWVRQHFLHYLVNHYEYPKALIRIEGGLKFNTLSKRSDIVVFDREGKPWMLVECKSPDLKMSDAILRQASAYNVTLKAKYLTVTNGLVHYCCRIDHENQKIELLSDLPGFEV